MNFWKVLCVEPLSSLRDFWSYSFSVRSSFDVNNWAIYELMGLPASIHCVQCVRVRVCVCVCDEDDEAAVAVMMTAVNDD